MSVNWESIREEEYPSIKKHNLTYFLSAGASLMNRNAYEIGIEYFNQMYKYGDINHERFFIELENVRNLIAEYINTDSEEIAFLVNTSSGIAATAYMFKNDKGEILYPSIEFPASIHMFNRLGFTCTKIMDTNGMYPIESFNNYVSNATKYIVHSHVQSFNGFRQDLKELGIFCRKNNLINIVNSTQAFGVFEINMQEFNIDVLISNALKWLGCGYGIGILSIKKKLSEKYQLPFTGWLSVDDPFAMDNENLNIIQKTRSMDSLGGCPNFASLLTLKGGLSLIKQKIGGGNMQSGIKKIQERIINLTSEFLEMINDFNFKIITPEDEKYRSGIITVEHIKAKKIHRYLTKHNIYTTLKTYPKAPKETLIRFAINFYNNSTDIERVKDILNSCQYIKKKI
ncbi:MAG: aminotransferase class V-fold PLP-dependent enzyme [Promethearchaeota archaeon]|nr:MAG: aminotransferase class V-fold PLP-dependent enzyme [Candidatus Lokiarchaeota archaeon]